MSEQSQPLFSKKNLKLIKDPLNETNPISVQVLGVCSALAITIMLKNAFVMAVSVTVVTMMSNYIISLMRNFIPDRIRIIVQLIVVAVLVITVDQILKAYVYDVSKQLSVFVGLIITNCIVMGRLEAYALANKPLPSLLDGFGNGIGYGWILLAVGFVRELTGTGAIWGFKLIPDSWLYKNGGFYEHNGLMLFPPMALICVAIIIWIQRSKNPQLIEKN